MLAVLSFIVFLLIKYIVYQRFNMLKVFRNSCCFLIISLLILVCRSAQAQLSAVHDYLRTDSVLVMNGSNDTLNFPFAGGMNSCQFVNIDMNLDGTDDLLVFDRHGYRILPFVVVPSTPSTLKYTPGLASLIPHLEQWVQAVDYNHDGKKDLFTYTTGGIKVFRNDSKNFLSFTQVTHPFLRSKQGTTLTNILVTYADYPGISDIDGDGDVDILTFWGLGSFIEYHRNTSVERFGNADSLTFEKESSCWGHFAEGNESNVIVLDTCPGVKKTAEVSLPVSDDPKHTGSTLLINDFNGDGLSDLAVGDVDFSSLVNLLNGGTNSDARMVQQTTSFPDASNPVNLNTFPAAMLADVNNDGLKDLLVSPFDPSLTKGENFSSSWFYKNSGTNLNPAFSLVSKSFLQDEMLDFGSGAYPVFMDYNNDGLTDILVGNYGYSDTCIFTPAAGLTCSFTSKLALLLNIGTANRPKFRLADRNIAGLGALQMQSLIPSVADMDGDGDLDLVCGNAKGKLVYCQNMAAPNQPADFKLVDPAWFMIDVGDFSAPQLFDVDHDGLTDLVCGKRDGTLSLYLNTGTKNIPQLSLVTNKWGNVDVTDTLQSYYGYSVPCLYRDKQGETRLFAGSEFGDIFVYDAISGNSGSEFRLMGALPGIKLGWRSAVALGNLNNDTLTDMLVGNYSGGLSLFFGKPDKIFGIGDQAGGYSKLLVIPNPATDYVFLSSSDIVPNKPVDISIQSIDGAVVKQFGQVLLPAHFNINELRNGIYIITARYKSGMAGGKVVICR